MDNNIYNCLDRAGDTIRQSVNQWIEKNDARHRLLGLVWDIKYADRIRSWTGRQRQRDDGFIGRVWIRLDEKGYKGFGSDRFSLSRSYPGTGGYGSYDGVWADVCRHYYIHVQNRKTPKDIRFTEPCCFSWDYRIFCEEWPDLAESADHEKTVLMLRFGRPSTPQISHRYSWFDEGQVEKDRQFIEKTKRLIEEGALKLPKSS